MASYVIKGNPPEARACLTMLPMESVVVSVVTQAELLGLARKGYPAAFSGVIREFLLRVTVLPWDSDAASVYGDLRSSCVKAGITLGALDMMIAAHAVSTKSTLVTHDRAFSLIPDGVLDVEDWIVS